MRLITLNSCIIILLSTGLMTQVDGDFSMVRAEVDFSKTLRVWDGFGVNYVETAQTVDYTEDPQEYGGFSLLSEDERNDILDLVFGEEGLKPGIIKMFYDPWHQKKPGGEFDHESTTKWMRTFVRGGLERTHKRGEELTIFTTLYGPPAWATKQKILRGRNLDPEQKYNLALYMVDWVKFLKEKEKFPVKFISLHNEGEDWHRWPVDGLTGNIGHGHDYNMFWPPEQVVDFIKLLKPMLDAAGLHDVGVTPGEPTNWYRFSAWGYADAIADDEGALQQLGLVTSHGFYGGSYGRWFGEHRSVGIDMLRAKRPDLHCWVTSTSWSKMDANNLKEMHGNIYTAKVNAITPWACIQRPGKWIGGDPNPGCAFRVYDDGTYEVMRGYYYYKQICRAGQPGMAVARTMAMDSEVAIIGFSRNGTDNPDAFVVVNIGKADKKIGIRVEGGGSKVYHAFRTTDDDSDRYKFIGLYTLDADDLLVYESPARSATTFYAGE
jgi:O-glycosyl hydrolase